MVCFTNEIEVTSKWLVKGRRVEGSEVVLVHGGDVVRILKLGGAFERERNGRDRGGRVGGVGARMGVDRKRVRRRGLQVVVYVLRGRAIDDVNTVSRYITNEHTYLSFSSGMESAMRE